MTPNENLGKGWISNVFCLLPREISVFDRNSFQMFRQGKTTVKIKSIKIINIIFLVQIY